MHCRLSLSLKAWYQKLYKCKDDIAFVLGYWYFAKEFLLRHVLNSFVSIIFERHPWPLESSKGKSYKSEREEGEREEFFGHKRSVHICNSLLFLIFYNAWSFLEKTFHFSNQFWDIPMYTDYNFTKQLSITGMGLV